MTKSVGVVIGIVTLTVAVFATRIQPGFARSISSKSSTDAQGTMPPLLDAGFKMFATPRTLDGPGQIFRIDDNGIAHSVRDISKALRIDTGQITVPVITTGSLKTITAGARLSLLGAAPLELGAHGGDVKEYQVSISLSDALQLRTQDYAVDHALAAQIGNIVFHSHNRYYLIRETIQAKGLAISLERASHADAGFKAALNRIITAAVGAGWSHTQADTYTLKRDFPSRENIFYKADEISVQGVNMGGGTTAYTRVPVRAGVLWVDSLRVPAEKQ